MKTTTKILNVERRIFTIHYYVGETGDSAMVAAYDAEDAMAIVKDQYPDARIDAMFCERDFLRNEKARKVRILARL